MRFTRKDEEDYSLQLTPLIDVVFLLLIFFMVSTAFVDFTRQLNIELPESQSGAPISKTKVYTIEINREGSVFLDGRPVLVGEIAEKIAQRVDEKRSVIIRADKKLHYGQAVEIMGICRDAGITDIGLAVQ